MAQVKSQADISFDDKVEIGRGDTPAWTQLYGLEAISFPEFSRDKIKVTHQQSPSRTHEYKPGLKDASDWELEKQWWPADPGDEMLAALVALTDAGNAEDVLLRITIGTEARTYSAYVDSYDPAADLGEVRKATARFVVAAKVVV
ncbi:phage tail tube protein [Paracoccus sp. p3-h83]|uniref:phage tail tube protein n=1 Tax=Paracoccus sp. p3-h83 TaxID=3342805 RepID=UPI0035B762C8